MTLIGPAVLLVALCAGCSSDSNGDGRGNGNSSSGNPGPAPAGVSAQVWSDDGFVDTPAFPAHSPLKIRWQIKGDADAAGSPAGRFAEFTGTTTLTGYDTGTGKPVWHTPLPVLRGTAPAQAGPGYGSMLEAGGAELVAADRELAPRSGDAHPHQIDVFDAVTGAYRWTRVDDEISAPDVLDSGRLLFGRTEKGEPQPGLGEVDARTGEELWHNPAVGACSIYSTTILCADAATGKNAVRVDPATGRVLWTAADPGATPDAYYWRTSVVDQTVYLSEARSSELTAVDLATGKVRWRQNTQFDDVAEVLPLDSGHVAVAGSARGSRGAVEDIVSLDVATGARKTFWSGSGGIGRNLSNGGISLVRISGRQYYVLTDPDGSVHTIDMSGAQQASVSKACEGGPDSVLGDTVACPNDGLTFYSLPGLRSRGTAAEVSDLSQVSVVHGTFLVSTSDTLTALGS